MNQAAAAARASSPGRFGRPVSLGLGGLLAGLFFLESAMAQLADASYIAPAQQIEDYLEAIENMEADYGPYATELSDLYLGLGQTLIKEQEYERARDAMNRGIMVLRVNSGPNSPEQTNQLYELANLEALLGKSDVADEIMHNIWFINAEFYGEYSPEMLPVLERIHSWYEVRRPLGTDDSDVRDYERNIDITEEMKEIAEEAYGKTDPRTGVAYKQYAEAQFQMVRHLTGLGMPMTREEYVMATRGSLIPMGMGSESVDDYNDKGRRAYRRFMEALEANPATTPVEYATALADLADWYMIFDRSRRGRNMYEEAYRVLAQSPQYAAQAAEFMKKPEPMHFISTPEPGSLNDEENNLREMNLEISMTVTSSGDARNITFLNPPEQMGEEDLWQIRKKVQEMPFRPALVDGEVVTTEQFLWNYVIVIYEEVS